MLIFLPTGIHLGLVFFLLLWFIHYALLPKLKALSGKLLCSFRDPGFSLFWDFFLPPMLLALPFFLLGLGVFIFLLNPWHLLALFLAVHFLLSFPSILLLHRLRSWRPPDDFLFRLGFHPHLWLEILFSLSYIYIFLFLVLFLRYLRLGQPWDWSWIYDHPGYFFLLSLAFLPWVPQVYAFFLLLRDLRQLFSLYLGNLSYSLHLRLLTRDFYFHPLFFLHKIYFSVNQWLLYPYSLGRQDQSYFQLLRGWIFLRFPLFLSLFNVVFLLLEFLLCRGHIHLSPHLFFHSFLALNLFLLWRKLGWSDFSLQVCFSDYVHRRWSTCRFPPLFWEYFPEAQGIYGFSWPFSGEEESLVLGLAKEWKLSKEKSFDFHRYLLDARIRRSFPRRYDLHHSSLYYKLQGVRWVHTSTEAVLHNATSLYARNFMDLFALLDSPQGWHFHYRAILSLEKIKSFDFPSHLYVPSSPSYGAITPRFVQAQENNFLDHFSSLLTQGISIHPYTESLAQRSSFLSQKRPDVFYDFALSAQNSFRGVVAYDGKASSSARVGSHRIFHSMSEKNYVLCLRSYESFLHQQGKFTPPMSEVLEQMVKFCAQKEKLFAVFFPHISLFPPECLPPLKVPSPISTEGFSSAFLESFSQSQNHNKRVSDFLRAQNIAERKDFQKPLSAEDLLADSYIQSLLK